MANFSLDLNKWIAKANGNAEKLVREVVIGLSERIIERTPVGDPDLWEHKAPPGYVGGRAKANWQYGFGSAPEGALDAVDATGQASIARTVAGVSSSPAIGVHYIVNNLPYAQALEDGHSKQSPPNAMVGLAVVEFQSIVNEEAAKLK